MLHGSGTPEAILTKDSSVQMDGMQLYSQLGLVLV